ncbi:MAG: phytanoyl-CoA dioxygenase family protein [Planctomycetes bacterium]|nr:phytanoyl-CoA dioxygenase family protein [Planctomycetota bacterium]
MSWRLGEAEQAAFENDGFFVVEGFLDDEETRLLQEDVAADVASDRQALERRDATGDVTRLAVKNELSADLYSAIVRSERIVRAMEVLLGGEVYHYHHKLMLKDPHHGGAWEWHQDYGYWYNNGCLFPYLASCMIAVDAASVENGCLQVVRGSHHLGRIEHGKVGDQTGAEVRRVAEARRRLETVHCEMGAGSAVFFHCNLLHRSDRNGSDRARTALIGCYNAARNDPYQQSHHPSYTPLEVWPDARILEVGRARS